MIVRGGLSTMSMYSVLDTVLISGWCVSVMWFKLLISCPLWSSVYECQKSGVWYVCDVLYAVLYVGVC